MSGRKDGSMMLSDVMKIEKEVGTIDGEESH